MLRLGDVSTEQQTLLALEHAGRETDMRRELSAAVAGLFAGMSTDAEPLVLTDDETRQLVALATLTSRCRSAVEAGRLLARDGADWRR